jgi:hypothetical protein
LINKAGGSPLLSLLLYQQGIYRRLERRNAPKIGQRKDKRRAKILLFSLFYPQQETNRKDLLDWRYEYPPRESLSKSEDSDTQASEEVRRGAKRCEEVQSYFEERTFIEFVRRCVLLQRYSISVHLRRNKKHSHTTSAPHCLNYSFCST